MAKGNFLTTVVRGKLGNMVGYKNTASNNAEKQAWRAYVSQISNPRTEAQARQRMIVANLLKNYSALKPIISRGFENVRYGGPSYRRFLKLNMTRAGQGPFVIKGRKSPVPGPYQISEGSLIPVTVSGTVKIQFTDRTNTSLLVSDLYVAGKLAITTFGQLCREIIANNSDIKEGDQLTFITVSETSNLQYIFRYQSFVIDPNSTEELTQRPTSGTVAGFTLGNLTAIKGSGREIQFMVLPWENTDEVPVAGAVIQSRQGEDGQWLRSPASLWCAELEDFFSEEIYQLALESYMSADGSRTSDWPTEEDPDITATWATVLKIVSATVGEETTNGIPALTITNGERSLLVVRTVDGTDMICYRDGSAQTFPASSVTTATDGTVNVTELASYGITL